MAVAFRATANSTYSASRSPSCNTPAGITNGDWLAYIVASNTTHATTTPTGQGFTAASTQDNSVGTNSTVSVFWKIASGEPASYTFTNLFAANETGGIVSVAYSGVDTTTPINTQNANTTAAAGVHNFPSVTPSVDNCVIVAIGGGDPTTSARAASPSGSPLGTERLDLVGFGGGSDFWIYIMDYAQGAQAAVALQLTIASSGNDDMAKYQFALAPAVAAGGDVFLPDLVMAPHIPAGGRR